MNALPQHKVTSLFATPSISIEQPLPKVISKTPGIMMRLKEMAERGFSPSSLNQYIKNPIAFFEQRVMGIQELTSVEESPEAATFGTIVHEVLEILYTPFVGKNLSETELLKKLKELPKTIQQVFLKHYPLEAYQRGKNRVIYEVINYQINQFINAEIDDLNNGATIKIIALEQQISSECTIEELEFPVRFSGIVDRIDQRDGILRIIDYKTSAVKAGELTMLDFENITNDEKYSKALQVLIYGTMWKHQKDSQPPFEAGVISFKNLAEGFLRFGIKEVSRPKSPPKDYLISSELIETFETRVKELLLEIFDSKKPFIEKSI
jgi:ATP-dependent exoDNAse (exonuclease V) beta subunit